ncbi:hypothetical protein PYW07_004251 [Mythimna separata]|uniref:Peptidase S1 domain-containing protein n=1 Tax=Mythimna separata TaxID=271217 RepID=A0AAD7YY43_MYTSE|nr:hypothetical protein PYW07_004251 [Mythimna separata]
MSSVAVFVFLLDNLAGFNHAMNDTLFENAMFTNSEENPIIQDCDPFTTDQILNAVSQDLDLVIVPSLKKDKQFDNGPLEEQSSEILDKLLDDNYQPEPDVSRSFDENKSKFDNDFTLMSRTSFRGHENSKKVTHEILNRTKTEFPRQAPFMVAIFETLENVTAQTCAGTLLSPHWVLTAANCIDVLSANNTNKTGFSHYTIVSESTNPLMDGSAHNVTRVVRPRFSNTSRGTGEEDGSYLALMRIEPEAEGPAVELMKEEVDRGVVKAFGWVLSRNESGSEESMKCSSAESQILNHTECQAMYSYKDKDVLCLFSKDMDNVTQLTTGGPVLYIHDDKVKMLAVVQADEEVFVSYPVTADYDWIQHTISNK